MTLACVLLLAPPVRAGEPGDTIPAPAVPLLWESPGCGHQKLGSVEIELGERVSEITQDPNVPTVDYGRAMKLLADAGAAKGANAVVLRWHQGVYFTRSGRQSRRPVYVKLRGAAIRLPDIATGCTLQPVQRADLEARSRSGVAANVTSREAFAGE
ncbi:hypothetical protein ACFPOA_03825 [Lysobacter niabensis]|uniref:hypothetical protein n=1 Tax=Agrilutibacter niabensis TaxID=380628 RepID=UPI00361217B7